MKCVPTPSPKLRPIPIAKAQRWYPFYAMFSDQFATSVIAHCGLPTGAVILDPWVGAGTTIAAAMSHGYCGIGIDINPVMVTLTRARTINRSAASKAANWLAKKEFYNHTSGSLPSDDALLNWFGPRTARNLRSVQVAICERYQTCLAEQSFLLTALFEVTRKVASAIRTKNPTWVRRSPTQRSSMSAKAIVAALEATAQRRVSLCPEQSTKGDVSLGNSVSLPLPDNSVDLVLTSPPYCTRIDYAVTTQVELAVLGEPINDFRTLRVQTMGTTAIREAIPTSSAMWGQTCETLLTKIARHSSKGSPNYYSPTYLQYFSDLYYSLAEIARCTRPASRVVIVVQDSRYKELHVNLPLIVEEMGAGFYWRRISRTNYPATRNLRRVNTRSRTHHAAVDAIEAVIEFMTPSN